uniref:Adenylate kinase n=1 Tax=Setaria digitata TaxID=48799 RepID=A0A915Q1T5_9BILA
MAVKLSTYVCIIFFGSTSWLSTNSVWMELPLLTEKLPEGWSLPSYLIVVVQMASVGPLIYSIIRKCSKVSPPVTAIILILLMFCCLCTVLMGLFWSKTIFLFGQERSVVLMVLLFGMALVNSTSNVLFMPFMASFHASYLTAYFVGMGLSSLFPSIISILQDSGNNCITVNVTSMLTSGFLHFGVMEFNFVMLGWMLLATVAFVYLFRSKDGTTTKGKELLTAQLPGESSVTIGESSSLYANEFSPLSQHVETTATEYRSHDEKFRFGLLLFLMAAVNAQMNGIVPSVQSFASLPYSQKTYHLGLTLSNIVSPVVCFLPLFIKISHLSVLVSLTVISSVLSGLIIAFAAMSPEPILQHSVWGSILIIIIVICSVALNSFLRTILATALGEGATDNETQLFWGGVFIQIGSFLGSITMFPLINIFHLFTSAPPFYALFVKKFYSEFAADTNYVKAFSNGFNFITVGRFKSTELRLTLLYSRVINVSKVKKPTINSLDDIHPILFQTLHNLSPQAEKCINALERSIFYGFASLTALYLMFGSEARFLCNLICFIYPAYKSLRKVDERSTTHALKWMLYWTVFGALTLFDEFADDINQILPIYWLFKCAFCVYLFLPQTDGANRFRDNILAPIFKFLHRKPREIVSLFELQINRALNTNVAARISDSLTAVIQANVAKTVDVVRKAQIPIIFVIGAPCAGKGTQCAKIVEKYGLTHISTGDLLRSEITSSGTRGDALKSMMQNGELVPARIVLDLLKEAMSRATINGSRGFVIDGFPREVQSPDLVIYFEADEKTLHDRCIKRRKISGRFDDSSETIQKRLKTYESVSIPVIDYYAKKGKLLRIQSDGTAEDVFSTVETYLDQEMSKFRQK